MTELHRALPKRTWLRIYRIAGGCTAISMVLSIIITNSIMATFSGGINVQGLMVAIVTPLLLGGPMIFFLTLGGEKLRHANKQLEYMATTDWLTSCLNRGAFTRAVTAHLESRRSIGSSGALLVVDADEFKSVNDRFGHDVGDQALRLIARAVLKAVRGQDLVGRLGGEEFGVFLAETDAATADHLAERIRSTVSAIKFAPEGKPCPLSVSIGGATYTTPAQFSELYRLADEHLYEAKNAGRDCVAMKQAA